MSAKATALGALLKARRIPMGWKRLEALTGFDERTMRYWEAGVMPPLDKALIVARALGISLEELEAAALVSAAVAESVVADAARVLPAEKPDRKPSKRTPGSRRVAQPSPDE